jgi:hypothetical protein
MQNMHNIRSQARRLMNQFDDLPDGWDSEFHPAYDDLEREFAELRLHFGNQ